MTVILSNKPYALLIVSILLIGMPLQAQNFRQVQQLSGVEIEGSDEFGFAVDIDGTSAIVGAYLDDVPSGIGQNISPNSGSVYFYEQDSMGIWQLVTYADNARAANTQTDPWMGYSVSLSGDYAFIGVPRSDDSGIGQNPVTQGGSVYVFERNSEGEWDITQALRASNRGEDDFFGRSVSVTSDGYGIVGAEGRDAPSSVEGVGAVYFFQRNNNGIWVETQMVTSPVTGSANYHFGWSCDMEGDLAIVGTDTWHTAYIFRRDNGGTWSEEASLIPNDVDLDDRAGYSVAIAADYAVMGAYAEQENLSGGDPKNNAGAAYIFRRFTGWSQSQKLLASDRSNNDRFGTSVDIDDERCMIGAPRASEHGSVYVFELSNNIWFEEQKHDAPRGGLQDEFGAAIAMDGPRMIAGAPGARPDFNSPRSGTAYTLMQCDTAGQPQITKSFNTLAANTSDLRYQWYSCTDTALVDGANDFMYEPSMNGSFSVIVSNEGCRDTSSCFDVTLGIEGPNSAPLISLYPNPARTVLNLNIESSQQDLTIRLYNMHGEEVQSHRPANESTVTLPMEHLAPGVYLVHISYGQEVWSRQVVKL